MKKEIKRKTIIYGVIAVLLASTLATVYAVSPLITEVFFHPSTNQEPPYSSPEMGEAIPVSIDELCNNPSTYHEQRVTVSGTVSELGLVKGPYFMLDEKIWVCYLHEEASVDISNVENGDYVTVTGRFWSIDTIYAEEIQKT